jgi:hypothetical protein
MTRTEDDRAARRRGAVARDHGSRRVRLAIGAGLGREPTAEEIAEVTGIQPEEVESIRRSAQAPISLEKPVGDEEQTEFGRLIADEQAESPYERAVEALTPPLGPPRTSALIHDRGRPRWGHSKRPRPVHRTTRNAREDRVSRAGADSVSACACTAEQAPGERRSPRG